MKVFRSPRAKAKVKPAVLRRYSIDKVLLENAAPARTRPEPFRKDRKIERRDFAVEVLPGDVPDSGLFEYAMKDVRALGWSSGPLHFRPPAEIRPQSDEQHALRALLEFMRHGDVEIEQTPEYIEGAVQPRGRLYLEDLRSGRFSVQAHLDLHGLNQGEARFAVDEFILASVRANLTCIRVIHGRGRHSHKHQPVLKESIQRWLCSRRLGRYVVAYTSARSCDGGGGAVYILLRV